MQEAAGLVRRGHLIVLRAVTVTLSPASEKMGAVELEGGPGAGGWGLTLGTPLLMWSALSRAQAAREEGLGVVNPCFVLYLLAVFPSGSRPE